MRKFGRRFHVVCRECHYMSDAVTEKEAAQRLRFPTAYDCTMEVIQAGVESAALMAAWGYTDDPRGWE